MTLRNSSARPATIASVAASCGCIVLDQARIVGVAVAPSSEFSFNVQFETQTNPGEKLRHITATLTTGETLSAAIRLEVQGTWSVEPESVDFGELPLDSTDGSVPESMLHFKSRVDSLESAVVPDAGWIESTIGSADDDEQVVMLRVRREKLAPGQNVGHVVLRTSNRIKPDVAVMVRVLGVRELVGSPEHVFLVGTEVASVQFRAHSGQTVRIVKTHADNPLIRSSTDGSGGVRIEKEGDATLRNPVRISVQDEAGRSGFVLVTWNPQSQGDAK